MPTAARSCRAGRLARLASLVAGNAAYPSCKRAPYFPTFLRILHTPPMASESPDLPQLPPAEPAQDAATDEAGEGPFAHVRIKHGYTTAFVTADVEGLGTGLQLLVDASRALCITPDRVRLLRCVEGGGFVQIDEDLRLADQHVKNDDVIVAILQDDDGEWEEPVLLEYPETAD